MSDLSIESKSSTKTHDVKASMYVSDINGPLAKEVPRHENSYLPAIPSSPDLQPPRYNHQQLVILRLTASHNTYYGLTRARGSRVASSRGWRYPLPSHSSSHGNFRATKTCRIQAESHAYLSHKIDRVTRTCTSLSRKLMLTVEWVGEKTDHLARLNCSFRARGNRKSEFRAAYCLSVKSYRARGGQESAART
ncbi:hypothetical protein NEOLEDRAFT_539436 [Neolentinus lepideus HHB14362 ss-1]|uniref:Uncharacterized protein n=1 Tax=Neolentinus lepideus HHB14362 ss-1 TaxID=1314782 RepID=A0A165RBQ9_9AGAM|nr:hypothetical protein NEOLEDRAFT_539436 [Neolentinus lepideus HHB14362 ss-1]